MFESNAYVRIGTPQRCASRLANHFEHRVPVHHENGLLRIDCPEATCALLPSDQLFDIELLAATRAVIDRCRQVGARRLERAATCEVSAIDWPDSKREGSESVAPGQAG